MTQSTGFSTTNPYLNKFDQFAEQKLHEDLIDESIKINGVDVYYLVRTVGYEDTVMNEAVLGSFTKAYYMPMYMNSVEGFEGRGDFLGKFGIQIEDQVKFVLSRRTFRDNAPTQIRNQPHEGDLIYFPLAKGTLFEIKFVEDEVPFYQFGVNHTWLLTCELFSYSGERFATGYDFIDNRQWLNAYTITIDVGDGSGTFTLGETVYQGNSLATANVTMKVARWDAANSEILVVDITGAIATGSNVIGATSGADYVVSAKDEFEMITDPQADNLEIEEASNAIENWDETSVFGSW